MADVIERIVPNYGIYRWDEWMDGQPRKAVKGVDFDVEPASFKSAVYMAALRATRKAKKDRVPKRYKAVASIKGDDVDFSITPISTARKPRKVGKR